MFVLVMHWSTEATNHSERAMLANTIISPHPLIKWPDCLQDLYSIV